VNETSTPKVLLITTQGDLSADLLITELLRHSATFIRWNQEDFPVQNSLRWTSDDCVGHLQSRKASYDLKCFRSIWYRRTSPPKLPCALATGGTTHFIEAEIRTVLEGVWQTSDCFWVNYPAQVHAAENKLLQLAMAKRLGFPIPRTLVTNDAPAAADFIKSVSAAVVKAVSTSGAELDGRAWSLFTHPITVADLSPTMSLQIAPCILQEQIPRKSDIRVTVVGSKVFSTEISIRGERAATEVDWRAVVAKDLHYVPHALPNSLAELCRSMMKQLDLRYGCFDFIRTPDNRYVFLEINPSGQWGWIEHETDVPITSELAQLLLRGRLIEQIT